VSLSKELQFAAKTENPAKGRGYGIAVALSSITKEMPLGGSAA
jgi:hypothetical protein